MNAKENMKINVWAAIIVAVLSVILTTFYNNWNKMDDVVTQKDMMEYVAEQNVVVLEKSEEFTIIQIEAMKKAYNANILHLEKLIDTHFEVLNERLDRIDKRMNK